MKRRNRHFGPFLVSVVVACAFAYSFTSQGDHLEPYHDNEPDKAASLSAFDTILTVLKSPRCMNCHPTDNLPMQGEDRHKHLFEVQRGKNDTGMEVQKCASCHHEENNEYTDVPGAPHWQLAPISMGWYGLSDVEIGKRLVDTTLNGNRSPEDLVHHMSHDPLVLWAWNPGKDRTPPPIELVDFKIALNNWLKNGAFIPEE